MAIFEVIPSRAKKYYLPATAGQRGSRALWKQFDNHNEYWQALGGF